MKDAIKYAALAVGGWLAFDWWQNQNAAEPAPSSGGVEPGVQPGQSPAPAPSTPAPQPGSSVPPPATQPNVGGITAQQLINQRGSGTGNFWEWNYHMAQLNHAWSNPAAQPFFPGLTDEQIAAKQISAGEYIAKLQAAGWV